MPPSASLLAGLVAAASLGAPLGSTPKAWISVSGTSCGSSPDAGVVGGALVTIATNPVLFPKTFLSVQECRDMCETTPGCDAYVMQDIDESHPTCWLRKGMRLTECADDDSGFTLYLNPAVYKSESAHVLSYPGMNCLSMDTPAAANEIFPTADKPMRFGVTMATCEENCRSYDGCTGYMWMQIKNQTQRLLTKTCWMLTDVQLDRCKRDASTAAYEIRMLDVAKKPAPQPTTIHASEPTSADMAGAWPSMAGTNCHQGAGGDPVDPSMEPIPGHHLLQYCQSQCTRLPDCEAVLMLDTHDDSSDNCYLRKNVKLEECMRGAPLYNLWMRPSEKAAAAFEWKSYAGTNCQPGHGADRALIEQDALDAHLDMVACEQECMKSPGCQAVVYRETGDGSTPNCYLRKNIDFPKCRKDPSFSLRLLVHPPPSPPTRDPWHAKSARNCDADHGGAAISQDGYNPFPSHIQLADCQALCEAKPDCVGIVMFDIKDPDQPNCFLRGMLDLARCTRHPAMNVWFKPGQRDDQLDEWLSYESTDCEPGHGADDAVKGEDVLSSHLSLDLCEQRCQYTVGCEAIVWKDGKNPMGDNCRLRKNVLVSECHVDPSYNLRIMNKDYDPKKKEPPPSQRRSIVASAAKPDLTVQSGSSKESSPTATNLLMSGSPPKVEKTPASEELTMQSGSPKDSVEKKASTTATPVTTTMTTVTATTTTVAHGGASTTTTTRERTSTTATATSSAARTRTSTTEATASSTRLTTSSATSTRKTATTTMTTTSATTTTTEASTTTSSSSSSTRPPQEHGEPWPTVFGKLCKPGEGASELEGGTREPVEGHQLLKQCQDMCSELPECEAVSMLVQTGEAEPNCWLVKKVDLTFCPKSSNAAVWFRPGGPAVADTPWTSFAATNCYPEGHGADDAVSNQDVVPGHRTLEECETICLNNRECEALIWQDAQDDRSNCYLRKNVVLSMCDTDLAFNMQVKSWARYQAYALTDGAAKRIAETIAHPRAPVAALALGPLVVGSAALWLARRCAASKPAAPEARAMLPLFELNEAE